MDREIAAILASRRSAAEQRAAHDTEKALALPAYVKAEMRVRQLSERAADDPTELAAYNAAVAARDAVLAAHGLSVEPQYVCKRCRDTGYADGRLCSCARELEAQCARTRFGIAVDPKATFGTADFARFGENALSMRMLYAKLQRFCDVFDETPVNNLVIGGVVGVGKTHLSYCIYNELAARGYVCLCCSAFSLDTAFFEAHTSLDKRAAIASAERADLLVIDDLGTEPIYRNVTLEYLFALLNERLLHRRRTVITTNLTVGALSERYGERVLSRLLQKSASRFFVLKGDDQRLQHC